MTDYSALMGKLQRGSPSINEANDLLAEAYGAIGKLETENEVLRKDAERYQLIRSKYFDPSILCTSDRYKKYFHEFMLCEDHLDLIVDTAVSKKS